MFIYLASPYSHASSYERFERYLAAMKATRWLIEAGESAFSPIVHCHTMAGLFEMPTDAGFWEKYNYGILKHADAVYILALVDWERSKGVKKESMFAHSQNIQQNLIIPNGEDYNIEPF